MIIASLLHLNITNPPLSSPSKNVMQVDVHLSVGQPQPVPHRQLLAVVGEVDVSGVPHLPQHGVQAHEVYCRVNTTPENNIISIYALNANIFG